MDRITINQIDRIEQRIEQLTQMIQHIISNEQEETLKGWYDEEVDNKQGQLHHLKSDKKLEEFINNLDEDTEEEEEYKQ